MPEIETHEEMKTFLLQVASSTATLSEADKDWLFKLIDGNCVCTQTIAETKVNVCRDSLFSELGLPEQSIPFDKLSEKQRDRIMLVMSLSSVIGKCPEHQH